MSRYHALSLLLLLSLLAAPALASAGDKPKIEKCSKAAVAEIEAAHAFITANLEEILEQKFAEKGSEKLKDKHKKKIRKKWGKINKIVCLDDKPACKKKTNKKGEDVSTVGRAHGFLTNRISVCYNNHVDPGHQFCELVDTLFHEAGHTFHIGGLKGFVHKKGDLLYEMGHSAKAVCVIRGDRPLKK